MTDIIFDIRKQPPSREQIEKNRGITSRRLQMVDDQYQKIKRLFLIVVTFGVVALAGVVLIADRIPYMTETGAVALSIMAAIVGAILYSLIKNRIARSRLLINLNLLTDVGDDAGGLYTKYVEWCKSYPEIAKYQQQVEDQGRKPVIAEHYSAYQWVNSVEPKDSAQPHDLRPATTQR